MRSIEAPGGIPTIVSGAEFSLFKRVSRKVKKNDMTEREVYLAQKLVDKNLLNRIRENGETYYIKSRGTVSSHSPTHRN
jgi:hypothetical protein